MRIPLVLENSTSGKKCEVSTSAENFTGGKKIIELKQVMRVQLMLKNSTGGKKCEVSTSDKNFAGGKKL